MATLNPKFAYDDPSFGLRFWENPSGVVPGNPETAEVPAMVEMELSHYLRVEDFGFQIPAGAEILGIEVVWTAGSLSGVGIVDQLVRVAKNGQIVVANRAKDDQWPSFVQDRVYGSDADLWDEAWTPDEINAPSFGAALSVRYDDFAGNDWARVYGVQISVFYSEC